MAKAKGVRFGRPPKELPQNFVSVYKKWINKELSIKEAGKACDMPAATFFYKVKKFKNTTFQKYGKNPKKYTRC